MTTKDSILALAAKISNDTVPNVATDAQALGELAKAMCGTAPEVPLATVDDAIAFITANYSGGGGGGVDVGPMTYAPQGYIGRIAANEDVDDDAYLYFDEGTIYVSDTAIALNPTEVAAGTTARLAVDLSGTHINGIPITGVAGFVVTFVDPDASPLTFETVRPWNGTITYTVENNFLTIACVIPELESDEALWIHVITAN